MNLGVRASRLFTRLFILSLISLAGWTATADDSSCSDFLRLTQELQVSTRDLSTIDELKIMTFNVENLYMQADVDEAAAEGRPFGPKYQPIKSRAKMNWLRHILRETSPDIVTLQEVGSLETLQRFADEEPIKGLYQPFLVKGNDNRGIHIGFLVKRDLPFSVELVSNKDRLFNDPVEKRTMPVFSRDLPALMFRTEYSDEPFLIVMGNHCKSKRSREGDKQSNIWRAEQIKAMAEIVEEYQDKYGKNIPIVLGGDFNTEVRRGSMMRPLWPIMPSAFDVAQKTVPGERRYTHTYRKPRDAQQLDDLRVTRSLQDLVLEANIYAYKDSNGVPIRIPRSKKERNRRQASDHRPAWIRISTAKMRAKWGQSTEHRVYEFSGAQASGF